MENMMTPKFPQPNWAGLALTIEYEKMSMTDVITIEKAVIYYGDREIQADHVILESHTPLTFCNNSNRLTIFTNNVRILFKETYYKKVERDVLIKVW